MDGRSTSAPSRQVTTMQNPPHRPPGRATRSSSICGHATWTERAAPGGRSGPPRRRPGTFHGRDHARQQARRRRRSPSRARPRARGPRSGGPPRNHAARTTRDPARQRRSGRDDPVGRHRVLRRNRPGLGRPRIHGRPAERHSYCHTRRQSHEVRPQDGPIAARSLRCSPAAARTTGRTPSSRSRPRPQAVAPPRPQPVDRSAAPGPWPPLAAAGPWLGSCLA